MNLDGANEFLLGHDSNLEDDDDNNDDDDDDVNDFLQGHNNEELEVLGDSAIDQSSPSVTTPTFFETPSQLPGLSHHRDEGEHHTSAFWSVTPA